MTEEVIDSGAVQDQPVTQDSNQLSHSASSNEQMISTTRMNEIVHERTKAASQKAYERGLQEAEQRASRQGSGLGGMPQVNEEQLRQMMANVFQEQHSKMQEDFRKQQIQQQLDQLANDFMGKLDAAKDAYPDLAKRQNEISEFATLVPFINETDAAAGITQHLLDNGHNVASLLVLSQTSPTFLRRELQKLAQSIKTNDEARSRPRANDPLDQITPSAYTTDSGSDSIEALKQQPWLRG